MVLIIFKKTWVQIRNKLLIWKVKLECSIMLVSIPRNSHLSRKNQNLYRKMMQGESMTLITMMLIMTYRWIEDITITKLILINLR